MKKTRIIIVALFATTMLFGCLNNEKKPITKDEVIGKWEQKTTKSYIKNGMYTEDKFGITWFFNADGTFKQLNKTIVDNKTISNWSMYGKWNLNNDTIKIIVDRYGDEEHNNKKSLKELFVSIYIIQSISKDTMDLKTFDKNQKEFIMSVSRVE